MEFYSQKKHATNPVVRYIHKIMLNGFGGKFGMKDILSTMKIIRKEDFKKYDKNYNVSAFADINDEFMLIKYSGRINETLRKFYKESGHMSPSFNLAKGVNDGETLPLRYAAMENDLDFKKLNRIRGTFSSVPIAAAMTAYARMSINKYKNIPGNLCIYSDTDSVVLTKPLNNIFIGTDIGQLKLEHEIAKGLFIRTKLYAFYNKNKELIIKSSGISPKKLN